MERQLDVKGSLVAGVLAGIGASVCCVGPLVLLALGIGGAWIGNLTALEPYLNGRNSLNRNVARGLKPATSRYRITTSLPLSPLRKLAWNR